MIRFTIILILSIFLLEGCYLRTKKFWTREETKMQTCREAWTYQDLSQPALVKILLFRNRLVFDRVYPAFIIGINDQKDTVAFIDKDFDGIFEVNSTVKVTPANWTPIEKVELDPVFSVYPKSKVNDFHCVVKVVYYGKFSAK